MISGDEIKRLKDMAASVGHWDTITFHLARYYPSATTQTGDHILNPIMADFVVAADKSGTVGHEDLHIYIGSNE